MGDTAQIHVGEGIAAENARWTFGANVPNTFEGHVAKSVPLYDMGHDLVCKISDYFLSDDSTVYEIGTSTGLLLERLVKHNQGKKIRWVGIDCEEGMIAKAREKFEGNPDVTLEVGDVNLMDLEKADLIVSYYCIQFIKPKFRQPLFDKIYNALNWGGAFVLFEKVRGPDARFQDMFTALYHDYKLDQGYSPDEIVGKSRSLKGVLEPFSTQANLDFLKRSGFVDVVSVMKYLCFEGFLAVK